MDVDPGINPGHVLAARFVLPSFLYPSQQTRVPFYQRLLERIESVPGVRSAALITKLPIASQGGSSWFIRENRPALHPEELLANNRLVSEGYFRTLGIPLRAGRAFSSHDGADAPLVAVINETMARKFWPGENPIGLRFRFYDKPWVQIVGIVGDVRQAALDADPLPEIYRPFVQDGQSWLAPRALVIRAQGDPLALAPAVHREFQALDRAVPVYGLDSMDALLGQSVASRKLEVMLVGAFGSLALLLASIGIYGVVSYAVARRGQEIGIRMALGATRADVMLMMLHKALRPVIIGLSIGLLLAFELSRFLASELFRVEATDALTFSVVPLLMAAIAASAALLPSRRAARIDPALALRHD
jgi:predicted permease